MAGRRSIPITIELENVRSLISEPFIRLGFRVVDGPEQLVGKDVGSFLSYAAVDNLIEVLSKIRRKEIDMEVF
jgi:hypothetical protein